MSVYQLLLEIIITFCGVIIVLLVLSVPLSLIFSIMISKRLEKISKEAFENKVVKDYGVFRNEKIFGRNNRLRLVEFKEGDKTLYAIVNTDLPVYEYHTFGPEDLEILNQALEEILKEANSKKSYRIINGPWWYPEKRFSITKMFEDTYRLGPPIDFFYIINDFAHTHLVSRYLSPTLVKKEGLIKLKEITGVIIKSFDTI